MLLSCRPSCSPICSCDNVRSDTKDKQESLTTQRNVLYKEVLKRLSKRYFFFNYFCSSADMAENDF